MEKKFQQSSQPNKLYKYCYRNEFFIRFYNQDYILNSVRHFLPDKRIINEIIFQKEYIYLSILNKFSDRNLIPTDIYPTLIKYFQENQKRIIQNYNFSLTKLEEIWINHDEFFRQKLKEEILIYRKKLDEWKSIIKIANDPTLTHETSGLHALTKLHVIKIDYYKYINSLKHTEVLLEYIRNIPIYTDIQLIVKEFDKDEKEMLELI